VPALGFAAAGWACRRENKGGVGPEETWLAGLLATAGIAVAVLEGPRNVEALTWSAVCLLLAAPHGLALLRVRRAAPAIV